MTAAFWRGQNFAETSDIVGNPGAQRIPEIAQGHTLRMTYRRIAAGKRYGAEVGSTLEAGKTGKEKFTAPDCATPAEILASR